LHMLSLGVASCRNIAMSRKLFQDGVRLALTLFLAVQPFIVETLKMVRCSLLHSLGFLAGGRSESSLWFWLE
jgi:hypothetical protein